MGFVARCNTQLVTACYEWFVLLSELDDFFVAAWGVGFPAFPLFLVFSPFSFKFSPFDFFSFCFFL
jgi:hypothetical protein